MVMTQYTLKKGETKIPDDLDPLSERQLRTIKEFPNAKIDIHCGPYGCGKTFALNMALGIFAMTTKPPGGDAVILLVGRTAKSVKTNICNQLATFFGDNFKRDSGTKDGVTKDAVLFGHYIRIIGLNDSGAEDRMRGLNAYKIYGDEVGTWSEEHFDKIQGRLRGKKPEGTEFGFIGSTNPDSPTHWLNIRILAGGVNYIEWKKEDTLLRSAVAFYEDLIKKYEHNEAFLMRYVYGKWTAAEGLVYPEFNAKFHIVNDNDMDGIILKYKDLGIDYGLSNATAVLEIATDTDGNKIVLSEDYLPDSRLTQVVGTIRKRVINLDSMLRYVYLDPSANGLRQTLQDEGMHNLRNGDNSVDDGILYVKDLFTEGKLFIHESCTNLINELYTYAWSKNKEGKVEKKNDHACDAMRYGLYSARG